ncbi:MAG: hypothetical protein JXA20_10765 [Spirochaetes bacterium]|nr:hypothetical protein [Spirochaetota bacterium]
MKKIVITVLATTCVLLVAASGARADTERSNLYFGVSVGLGVGQPTLPPEFSNFFKGSPEPEFTYDVGLNFLYYFSSFVGVHAAAGYDSLPFRIDGKATPAGPAVTIPLLSGFSASFNGFTGSIKVRLNYFCFKLGPSFRVGGFFINTDVLLAVHMSSTYAVKLGNITATIGPFTGTIPMPEISGDYKEFRPIAFGVVIEPGYRFEIGGFAIPVSVGFRYMITPVGETDIYGLTLPSAEVHTWNVKVRIGFEF